jgi:hypothetical protein
MTSDGYLASQVGGARVEEDVHVGRRDVAVADSVRQHDEEAGELLHAGGIL